MAKKIVTLYIDEVSIRLLESSGRRIKRWGDLPLEPGLVQGGVVIKEAEVATKIRQLLKAQKVKAKKVIVGLSGLRCLTRPITLPQLPKPMLADAVIREAKRVLPVPLEQFYVLWQTIAAPQGKTRVFLTAIPCNTADALLRTLHKAGLKPYLIDLKPLALARTVKEATAVIVDVQPTEFDIVIMADGVPQPIRTVPLPIEGLSWQKKWLMVKKELDRTIKFYNSNNLEKPLASDVPIFIAGELADKSESLNLLPDEFGYPVLLLSSPLKCPERLDSACYLVNIGLALKELGKEAGPSLANLDTLPAPYRPEPISLVRVFALPSAITIVSLLIFLVMLIQGASANTVSMRSQLDVTNQLARQKQLQKQELQSNIAELKEQIAEAEASCNAFTIVLDSLDSRGSEVNQNLKVVTNTLPRTISLTSISYATDRLTISGISPSKAEVLSYAENLDASGRFSEIILANMKKIESEVMNFTLVLKTRG